MTVEKRRISVEDGLQNTPQDQLDGGNDGVKRRKVDEEGQESSDEEDQENLKIPEGYDRSWAYKNILKLIRRRAERYKITGSKNKRIPEYEEFFEKERNLFEKFQMEETNLQSTYITPEGSFPHIWRERSRKSVGTFWSFEEKEIFFYYLGRYGRNLEKIHIQLPKKSIMDIEMYYNLLSGVLGSYKRSKANFLKLIKYEDIPAAVEVDEFTLAIEEQIVAKNSEYENGPFNKRGKDDTEEVLARDLAEDDEDRLINVSVLNSICSFYQMEHFFEDGLPKDKEPNLGESFLFFKQQVENFIRNLVAQIIKIHLYLRLNLKFGEDDKLMFTPQITDIYFQALNEMKSNRPLGLKDYFRDMDTRLDFDVVDEEDRIKKYHPIRFDRYERRLATSQYLPLPEEIETIEEENGDSVFISDDKDQDLLLDNKLALKIFLTETNTINNQDLEMSKEACQNLLQQWNCLDTIEEFQKRWPKWERKQIKSFIAQSKLKKKDHRPVIEEPDDFDLQALFTELDNDDSIIQQNEEITEEMLFLYNLTFE